MGVVIRKVTENIRSETLNNLREIISSHSGLEKYIGSIFQVRLVVDTNVVISDLLWMSRRKKDDNSTAIIEVIKAGTLRAYAPKHLKKEVEKHLPFIAEKKKIPFEKIHTEWTAYQQHLEFMDIDDDAVNDYTDSVDPNDAPFVILSNALGAAGVISDDPHIESLGGKRIHVDIRLSLRDYSRAAAVAYSLRLGGAMTTFATVSLVKAVIEKTTELLKLIDKLPSKVKIMLVFFLIMIFIIPSIRNKVLGYLKSTNEMLGDAWNSMSPSITELMNEASEKGQEAERKLEEIQSHLS